MSDLRIPSRLTGAVDADVDGQHVALRPKGFACAGLSGSGAPVRDLNDGRRTTAEIVAALEQQLEAPAGAIRADTPALLDSLVAAGLVAELGPLTVGA